MSNPRPQSASIWLEGHSLHLHFPGLEGRSSGHTISIPLEKCSIENSAFGQPLTRQLGWVQLLRVLRAREHAEAKRAGSDTRIATLSSPTQYIIEQALKSMGVKVVSKRKAPTELTLEDLDV